MLETDSGDRAFFKRQIKAADAFHQPNKRFIGPSPMNSPSVQDKTRCASALVCDFEDWTAIVAAIPADRDSKRQVFLTYWRLARLCKN